jgi:hypothetical protein
VFFLEWVHCSWAQNLLFLLGLVLVFLGIVCLTLVRSWMSDVGGGRSASHRVHFVGERGMFYDPCMPAGSCDIVVMWGGQDHFHSAYQILATHHEDADYSGSKHDAVLQLDGDTTAEYDPVDFDDEPSSLSSDVGHDRTHVTGALVASCTAPHDVSVPVLAINATTAASVPVPVSTAGGGPANGSTGHAAVVGPAHGLVLGLTDVHDEHDDLPDEFDDLFDDMDVTAEAASVATRMRVRVHEYVGPGG